MNGGQSEFVRDGISIQFQIDVWLGEKTLINSSLQNIPSHMLNVMAFELVTQENTLNTNLLKEFLTLDLI